MAAGLTCPPEHGGGQKNRKMLFMPFTMVIGYIIFIILLPGRIPAPTERPGGLNLMTMNNYLLFLLAAAALLAATEARSYGSHHNKCDEKASKSDSSSSSSSSSSLSEEDNDCRGGNDNASSSSSSSSEEEEQDKCNEIDHKKAEHFKKHCN